MNFLIQEGFHRLYEAAVAIGLPMRYRLTEGEVYGPDDLPSTMNHEYSLELPAEGTNEFWCLFGYRQNQPHHDWFFRLGHTLTMMQDTATRSGDWPRPAPFAFTSWLNQFPVKWQDLTVWLDASQGYFQVAIRWAGRYGAVQVHKPDGTAATLMADILMGRLPQGPLVDYVQDHYPYESFVVDSEGNVF